MGSGTGLKGLKAAVIAYRERVQEPVCDEELPELRAIIDSLEIEFSRTARRFQVQGGHLSDGYPGVVSWLRERCKMSGTSAADRVCVGKELESLPETCAAAAAGEIGYQSVAAICHLHEQVGDQVDETALVEHARRMSVADFRNVCRHARYAIDPDGSMREEEFNFKRRRLHISETADGMHVLDAILDPAGGAAVKTALEGLAFSGVQDDGRKHSQRMADALVELSHHVMDQGRLPARRGVKPHVTVSTTLEALQGLPGGAAIERAPISQKTLERMACDCTMSRVLLADSVVIDVGRATRSISPATRRAVHARDKHCRWPGCDRPISWTSPHHIEFWSRGGPTKLPNLLSLCWFHHRLVHEGGWQVVKTSDDYQFIRPPTPVVREWRRPYSRAA